MLFDGLSDLMYKLENISSRNDMIILLSDYFGKMNAMEVKSSVYLLLGRIAPPFKGLELGLGDKLVIEAISRSTGYSVSKIEFLYNKLGDLGLVAEQLISKKLQTSLFSKKLTIEEVYNDFLKIASYKGSGSQDQKISIIIELLNNLSPISARYVVRMIIGRLRLGVGDSTILDALSYMINGDKSERSKLELAYNLCSDLGRVAYEYKSNPASINDFHIHVFNPIRPALAERLPDGRAILSKMNGHCFVEAKYDGFRLQCHKKGDHVEIYSRRMERITDMLPDVVSAIRNEIKVDEIIFEGEAIGYDPNSDHFYNFQETIRRKRKHDINKTINEVPLYLFAFDILYLNGKDLMNKPFRERRKILESIVKESNLIHVSEGYLVNSVDDLEFHFKDFISRGLEGLMAKNLDAHYTVGARKFTWIKLKKSYSRSLSDSIDAVIVGYYYGKGSRTKLGIGGLLCAVYDPHNNNYQTIAKVGSGFTEEQMIKLHSLLDSIKLTKKPKDVISNIDADVWVEPRYVITLTADEITRSNVHTCGMTANGLGYALRFPRMIGFIRQDKSPEYATTVDEIISMYNLSN